MKIINAGYEIITPINREVVLKRIEEIGRVCYKSEDLITPDSSSKFVSMLIKRGHEAMIEHCSMSVKFICDRGVSHEIVRHRIASYAQESTRYVSSGNKNLIEINNDDDVIYAYQQGMSMKKISEKSNNKYTEWDVYKLLEVNDISKRSLGNRGLINEHYFSTIDTPEKAYLMGLIFADGNIRKDAPQLCISQKDDEQWWILNMIRKYIQPEANSLNIHNKTIYSDLISYGIIPNKTYDITESNIDTLWNSVKNFRYDFLRGLLDGDGNIRWFYQKDNSITQSCRIEWAGNEYLINKIKEFINFEFNYICGYEQDKKCKILYKCRITDANVGRLFCKKLYENFKFPYGHSKTVNWFKAFDIDIPIDYSLPNKKEFNVIKPIFFNDKSLWIWGNAMLNSEMSYQQLLNNGATPQEARSVLPNSLKTEIVVTYNLREWRNFFKLRTAQAAHPQMRKITIPLLEEFKTYLPEVFGDIEVENEQ